MRAALLLVILGCGAVADPPVETCEPAPEGFSAARSGDFVRVDRRLDGQARQGGVRLYSEGRTLDALPGTVDFGDVQLEVREDLTLCLLTAAPAE